MQFFAKSSSRLVPVLILALTLLAPLGAIGQDYRQYAPELKNDEELSRYIAYIREVIPEIFQPDSDWYVDPLKVVQNEQKFLTWLKSPEAQKIYHSELPKDRRPLQKIEVILNEPTQETQQVLTDAGRQKLKLAFTTLGARLPSDAAVDQEIASSYKSLKGLSSQGLLTGIIQSLPSDAKAVAFKLPPGEKLSYVLKHITDSDLKQRFRTNVYRPEEITVSHLIQEYQHLDQTEVHLADLLLYREWKRNGGNDDAFSKLTSLNPTQTQESLARVSVDPKDAKKFKDVCQGSMQAQLKRVTEERRVTVWQTKSKFTIEEVSPNIGIYRGCMNASCSTSYAYGFVYSPAERTYLVRDESGKLLTAAFATAVKVDGQPSLYLHDIGNSWISPDYGEKIFKSFYSARKNLGFEQIILGIKPMHYKSFQTSARDAAEPAEEKAIEYLDAATRTEIGETLFQHTGDNYSKAHDLPIHHSTGIVFVPKQNDQVQIEAKVSDFREREFTNRPLTAAERRDLIMEFLSRDQADLARTVFAGADKAGDPGPALAEINAALLNDSGAQLEEFSKNLQHALEKAGLGWDPVIMGKRSPTLARGFLNAPDCWQGPDSPVSKQTLDYISTLARDQPANPAVLKAIQAHPEIVRTPAFEKLFRAFVKDNAISMEKAKQFSIYFTAHPPLSPAVQDLVYRTLEFRGAGVRPLWEALALPHTPTPEQLEIVARDLDHQQHRSDLLNLIDKRPEVLQSPVTRRLFELRDSHDGGAAFTRILLLSGDHSPEVIKSAKSWIEKYDWWRSSLEPLVPMSESARNELVLKYLLEDKLGLAKANYAALKKGDLNATAIHGLLEAQNPKTLHQFLPGLRAQHELNAHQVELLTKLLKDPDSRLEVLEVIDSRPEILKGPLLAGMIELKDDPTYGDTVSHQLLQAGERSPSVIDSAHVWAVKAPQGESARWLIRRCIIENIEQIPPRLLFK